MPLSDAQDLCTDFEKGFLKVATPVEDVDLVSAASSKRAAPKGTPDREAESRAKMPAKPVPAKDLSKEFPTETTKVEMSAATIAALRGMMMDEIQQGMQQMQDFVSEKIDSAVCQLRKEFEEEREARKTLEKRVIVLEAGLRETNGANDNKEVLAVIGTFKDMTHEEVETQAKACLEGVDGVMDVYTTNPNPAVAFAQFSSTQSLTKFLRSQKKNVKMQQHSLWASQNRPAEERRRAKIASKTKKYLIEFDQFDPKDVTVNYSSYKIHARVGGRLCPVADVEESGGVNFAEMGDGPASDDVVAAVAEFTANLE
eukprot:Skav228347  [mRNA]  locus=scaffold1898:213384:214469:+ [translate_table: standard]